MSPFEPPTITCSYREYPSAFRLHIASGRDDILFGCSTPTYLVHRTVSGPLMNHNFLHKLIEHWSGQFIKAFIFLDQLYEPVCRFRMLRLLPAPALRLLWPVYVFLFHTVCSGSGNVHPEVFQECYPRKSGIAVPPVPDPSFGQLPVLSSVW